jgi:hypothetical protein
MRFRRVLLIVIQRDFSDDYSKIPPHGRWQHFNVGGRPRVEQLIASWPASVVDTQERTRRLIDMFVVSVLLDAGAGTSWRYKSKENGKNYSRSEGLAVASIEMFRAGIFSSNPAEKCQVDAKALKALTPDVLSKGLQVSEDNPIEGLEGRTGLLVRLGQALEENVEMFGRDQRPGKMLGMVSILITWTKANSCYRLSPSPSHNRSVWWSSDTSHHIMGCSHDWSCSHLAS